MIQIARKKSNFHLVHSSGRLQTQLFVVFLTIFNLLKILFSAVLQFFHDYYCINPRIIKTKANPVIAPCKNSSSMFFENQREYSEFTL